MAAPLKGAGETKTVRLKVPDDTFPDHQVSRKPGELFDNDRLDAVSRRKIAYGLFLVDESVTLTRALSALPPIPAGLKYCRTRKDGAANLWLHDRVLVYNQPRRAKHT